VVKYTNYIYHNTKQIAAVTAAGEARIIIIIIIIISGMKQYTQTEKLQQIGRI
jgi:hypothetical protein